MFATAGLAQSIYGAIRDSSGIDQLDFGVKALGATARRTWLHGTDHHNVPVTIGGALISPGTWIYANADCVLVAASDLDLTKVTP